MLLRKWSCLRAIATLCGRLNIKSIIATSQVPIVVKEVGNGFIREDLQSLQQLGVQFVDVGGRGGTNFATIENARRSGHDFAYLQDWGQTTVESLLEARGLGLAKTLATGGVRSPLDVVKALRLGAHAVGMRTWPGASSLDSNWL